MTMIPNNAHAAACFIEYRLAMIPKALALSELDLLQRLSDDDLDYMVHHKMVSYAEAGMHRAAIRQALSNRRCELAPRRATA